MCAPIPKSPFRPPLRKGDRDVHVGERHAVPLRFGPVLNGRGVETGLSPLVGAPGVSPGFVSPSPVSERGIKGERLIGSRKERLKRRVQRHFSAGGLGESPKRTFGRVGWDRQCRIVRGVGKGFRVKPGVTSYETIHPVGEGHKAEPFCSDWLTRLDTREPDLVSSGRARLQSREESASWIFKPSFSRKRAVLRFLR